MTLFRGVLRDDVVREIIASQLDVPAETVEPARRLIDDLGADLVSLTQLALALEDTFDITIADEDWIEVATVAEVIAYVAALLTRTPPN